MDDRLAALFKGITDGQLRFRAAGESLADLESFQKTTSSVETDLRKTFAKVRRALRKEVHVGGAVHGAVLGNVLPLCPKKVASSRSGLDETVVSPDLRGGGGGAGHMLTGAY